MPPVWDVAVLPFDLPQDTAMAFSPPAFHKYIYIYKKKIYTQSFDPARHSLPMDPDLGTLHLLVQHRWRWCNSDDTNPPRDPEATELPLAAAPIRLQTHGTGKETATEH